MSEESTHRRLNLFRLHILGQAVFQIALPECDSSEFFSADCLSCQQNTLCHLRCNFLYFFLNLKNLYLLCTEKLFMLSYPNFQARGILLLPI